MKKNWCHKIDISVTELDRELNAFSDATSDGRQKMRCRKCLAITWIDD